MANAENANQKNDSRATRPQICEDGAQAGAVDVARIPDEWSELVQGADFASGEFFPVIEGEPTFDLAAILRQLDPEDARYAIDMHAFISIDSDALSGDELIAKATDVLSRPIMHEMTLIDLDPAFRKGYTAVMEQRRFDFPDKPEPESSLESHFFQGLLASLASASIVFAFRHEGTLTYVVPDGVKEGFDKAIEDDILKFCEEVDLVHEYLSAAVNLYGIISVDDLAHIMMKLDPQTFYDEQGTRDHLLRIEEDGESWPYFAEEELIANDLFADEAEGGLGKELAFELARFARRIPRYVPNRETFLCYADPDFFEPNFEADLLKELLDGFFPGYDKENEEALAFVQASAREGMRSDVITETLAEDLLPEKLVNENQRSLLAKQVAQVVNTTRNWGANGRTDQEASSLR